MKKNCFTQDSIVNEPLSPERIFASSKSFLFKFVISRFLYCKKFSCYEKKNVSVCDRRKPNSCNPKNDFDREFLARALCTMVIMKLHPLFIYIYMYMYVQKRYFPLCTRLRCKSSRDQFPALARMFMFFVVTFLFFVH